MDLLLRGYLLISYLFAFVRVFETVERISHDAKVAGEVVIAACESVRSRLTSRPFHYDAFRCVVHVVPTLCDCSPAPPYSSLLYLRSDAAEKAQTTIAAMSFGGAL
jgi:hypothetical protein